MSNNGSNARPRRARTRNAVPTAVLAAAALALGAAPAGAHGGDTTRVHSCIGGDGNVKIIAASESCKNNELPLDWSRDAGAAGPTYSAGEGLTLSPANEFSVEDVPWGSLVGVPAGFADGVDNEGPDLTWGNLTGIPSDLLDGDDDGSAAVGAFATQLATDDGVPDQPGDPVSFSKIKDLTSASGDGRITGSFVRDGSIESQDIGDGTIAARDLAGSDAPGATVVGAVTSEKISDGTIQARDLASGVLDRIVTTTTIGPQEILAGDRAAVEVSLADVNPSDIVVVSPPAALDDGLVFAGSDVLAPGTVTIYLHNITAAPITMGSQGWTIRQLRTGG
jgi:hypothetical protein